jgi:hypothetical protein
MNRLVIVGNGFDLAHGMKTGYNDFILWYIKKCFSIALKTTRYSDAAILITCEYQELKSGNLNGVDKVVDYLYKKDKLVVLFDGTRIPSDYDQTHYNPFKVNCNSPFISRIMRRCSISNWVEIENEYYESLKDIIRIDNKMDKNAAVQSLNETLSLIIDQLTEYLMSIVPPSINGLYSGILASKIKYLDMPGKSDLEDDAPHRTMILNFNYTSTIEQYIDVHKTDLNYIHGSLSDKANPLIFGFGDELDTEYGSFETNKTKGIFRYIKSFWYFRTRNYHNLIRFIERDEYQVVILGHSCGLSDRTMLNMIFDDPNCKSVKIYHHVSNGKDNYTEITHEIARHFKNKQEMRRKIVPFDKESYMPQIH